MNELIFTIGNDVKFEDLKEFITLTNDKFRKQISFSHFNVLVENNENLSEYVIGIKSNSFIKGNDIQTILNLDYVKSFYCIFGE